MPRLIDEARQRRLVGREIEVARTGLIPKIIIIEAILRTELDVVLSPDIGHIHLTYGGAVIPCAAVS